MPAGSVYRVQQLLNGSLKGTGKKEWPDGTAGSTKVVPVKFRPSAVKASVNEPLSVSSSSGSSKETPSSYALADVVATLDKCIVLDVPVKPFFWLPPVPR